MTLYNLLLPLYLYNIYLVHHKIENLDVEFSWQRVRLFDEVLCKVLYERCKENPTALVLKVTKKPKSKWRPVPLDTIVSNRIFMLEYNCFIIKYFLIKCL